MRSHQQYRCTSSTRTGFLGSLGDLETGRAECQAAIKFSDTYPCCLTGHDGGHLAINYWYHPPDNLDSSKAGFKQPYTNPYYPTIWAERQPWLQQDTERWWQQQQQQRQQQLGLKGPSPGAAQQAAAGPQQLHVKVPDSTSRHIQWSEGAHSPTNKYRMSMTRQGTATGDASKKPSDCQENRYSPRSGLAAGTVGLPDIKRRLQHVMCLYCYTPEVAACCMFAPAVPDITSLYDADCTVPQRQMALATACVVCKF